MDGDQFVAGAGARHIEPQRHAVDRGAGRHGGEVESHEAAPDLAGRIAANEEIRARAVADRAGEILIERVVPIGLDCDAIGKGGKGEQRRKRRD